jgi:hypothetical protein
MRLCPQTGEFIDEGKCEECEYYRHWPEGSEEEPRECWFDWQITQGPTGSEEEEEE